MIAGLDTVAASLACFLSYLARHPDERRRLVADPSLWPSAIEELLRFESPVTDGGRIALADLELPSGEHIAAGHPDGHLVARRQPRSRRSSTDRSPSTSAAPRTRTSGSPAGSTAASVRTWRAWRCTSRSRSGTSGSPTTRSRRAPTSPTAATRARRTTSRSPGEPRSTRRPRRPAGRRSGTGWPSTSPASSPATGASAVPTDDSWWELRLAWERELAAGGWLGITWPVEYGGRGGTLEEELVFLEEHFRARAPYWVGVHGRDLFGPTLLHAGSGGAEGALPPAHHGLRGDVGAGLQRAGGGLRSRRRADPAVRDGDEWVLNGQKIWMTFGTRADWLYVLCRTNADAPKHRGLSLILVPADQPRRRRPADPQPRRRRGVRRGVLLRRAHPRPTSSWVRSTARGRS